MGSRIKFLSIILLSIILLSISIPLTSAATPKPLDRIEYYVYSDDNKGLLALQKGDIDIYVPSKPLSDEELKAAGIDLTQVRVARASGGIAVMLLNILSDEDKLGKLGIVTDPDGKKHFNPFAIREIRYAINLLINRKYIAEKVVGIAYPAFVALSPSLPYYSAIEKTIESMGFKPEGNEEIAKQIIDNTLTKIAEELKKYGYELYKKKTEDGEFWYFKAPGQDEERITINIATWWESYVYHCGAMRYFGEQLKKVGFDAKVTCTHARKLRDSQDWRYMHWHIYTYRRVISEDLLKIWFIDGMYWTYSSAALPTQIRDHLQKMNDTLQPQIDKAIEKLRYAKTIDDLVKGVEKVVRLVMNQSIVIAYVNPLRTTIVKNTVHDPVLGWASNIYNPWLYRAAWTDTGVMKIGFFSSEMNLLTPLNPTLGMHTLSRTILLMPVVDVGVFPNPFTGELTPLRVSWKVENASIPGTALYYDPVDHKWITTSEAEAKGLLNKTKVEHEHIVKVTYNYVLGKWQHGRDMTLADILLWLAWNLDWANNASTNDPWYFSNKYEHPLGQTPQALSCIYGIDIVNGTSLALYTSTDCVGTPDPNLVAEMFIGMINTWGPRSLWPWFPPELMMGIGYLRIYGGPVSGKQYILAGSETENIVRLDLTDKNSVEDLKAALEKIANGEYMPPFIKATLDLANKYPVIGKPDLEDGAKKLIDFANKYGHLVVSQGAYVITELKPDKIVFARFTDYPISLQQLDNKLKAAKLVLKSIEPTNVIVQAGKSTTITIMFDEQIVFPESMAGTKPAEEAYALARILKNGEEVAKVQAEKEANGKWIIRLDPSLTEKLEPGTYTVEIIYSITPEAPPSKTTITLTVLPKPSTTTSPTTTKPSGTTTPPTTPPAGTTTVTYTKMETVTETVTETSKVTQTNWGIVAGLFILGLIIGIAVGFAIKKR